MRKVGFSFAGDLARLMMVLGPRGSSAPFRNIVDLQACSDKEGKFLSVPADTSGGKARVHQVSLAKMVLANTGHRLQKDQQQSNWDRR